MMTLGSHPWSENITKTSRWRAADLGSPLPGVVGGANSKEKSTSSRADLDKRCEPQSASIWWKSRSNTPLDSRRQRSVGEDS